MGKARHFVSVVALIIVATLALRFIFGWMFALPTPASAEAVPIDIMFNWHFWMISFLFAFIMTLMLYSAVVFRRRPGDDSDGPHIHSNTGLEIGWTVVPVIVVVGFGVYGAVVLNDLVAPKPNEAVINVTAFQWGWRFDYPEEQEGVGGAELVLPVDQPVVLHMQSQDVLHSFWVPEFRVKQDLVPGRTTFLRFTPTEIGEYKVRCAEICGTGHANMRANVRVVSQADYEAWVEEILNRPKLGEMTPEERGQFWYEELVPSCAGCHSLDGTPLVGPSWQGLYLREEAMDDGTVIVADEDYIRESIINPNAHIVAGFNANVMYQAYGEDIPQAEAEFETAEGQDFDAIDDLIAFIKTLNE